MEDIDTATTTALITWLRTHDGVVSAAQARKLGASVRALRQQVVAGRLRRAGCGVFVDAAVAPNPRMSLRVAIVLAGHGAVISHRSAAWLWGLVDRAPIRPHVTVAPSRSARIPGVITHRSTDPPPPRQHAGFPVTDPCRTIIDMAAHGTDALIDALVDRALSRRLLTVAAMARTTQPGAGRPGTAALRRRLVVRGHFEAPEPSVLESRMGRLLRRLEDDGSVPHARAELACGEHRYRLDYAWPSVGLTVEVDGYAWHGSAAQMRHDCERRNRLTKAGWTFLVYTWPQVADEPEMVMAEIADTYRRLSRAVA